MWGYILTSYKKNYFEWPLYNNKQFSQTDSSTTGVMGHFTEEIQFNVVGLWEVLSAKQ